MPFSVARSMLWYLDVPALLRFLAVSRNCHQAVEDPTLWILKLKSMGAWHSSGELSLPSELTIDPLSCFDGISASPRAARSHVLRIRRCLQPFYSDLQSNSPYNQLRLFKTYHNPQDQARLLSNLLRYNAIDVDDNSRVFVRQKILDLLEIFENALLRELEIHYDIRDFEKTRSFVEILVFLDNVQTLIDFFLQKTCFDNDTIKFLNPENFDVDDFFIKTFLPDGLQTFDISDPLTPAWEISASHMNKFIEELAFVFNQLANVVDSIFPQCIPMMFKISEELIANQLLRVLLVITTAARERHLYLQMVPALYEKLTQNFISTLVPSQNVGDSYTTLVRELIDASYDSHVSEYMNEEKLLFREFCDGRLLLWNKQLDEREAETSYNILKKVQVESKSDFMSSFKKMFAIAPPEISGLEAKAEDLAAATYSKTQANAEILAENIKSLNKIFSAELALDILRGAKSALTRLSLFRSFTISAIQKDIHATMQVIYINVLESLGKSHLNVGFEKSLKHLKDYNPKDVKINESDFDNSAIRPLVIFFESIQVADMIVQMLNIFYKEEMILKNVVKNENSILNPSLQSKKMLEGMVDKYVADGLNIGIDVLFQEIDSVFMTLLKEEDYNSPPQKLTVTSGPTPAAKRVVSILDSNFDLLVGSAERSVVEVFQQEIAERFFQLIAKILKKSTISVDGAVVLISDLNLYYDFILLHIKSNKKMIFPLFQALKKVGTLYLISGDDANVIGQIVSDLSKFNGIFSQEEIYEFVQRRLDWSKIKRHVEKVMYGLSLADCCIS